MISVLAKEQSLQAVHRGTAVFFDPKNKKD